MRTPSILLVAPMVISATAPAAIVSLPSYDEPSRPWVSVESAHADKQCRESIQQVREDMGKPRVENGPARPDRAILQYAVDRRIDGCGMLVPVADPAEVLPLPQAGKGQLIPAEARQR